MKVIFPCSYYLPETAASLYITDNIVHACAEQDMEVFLYTPTPTRSVPSGAKWERREDLCDNKLHIKRFHLYGEGKNPLLRAFRYLLSEIIELHYCLWKPYDVAFIDSTPPIQGLKMPFIKFSRHKPIVYNAQDIFPDSMVGTGLTKEGSLIWEIGRIVEKITYRHADKIIVISEDFKRNIMAKGVPEEKIEVIYNWVDEQAVVDVPREENKLFDKYGLDRSKFYVEYSGNIGLTQNMDLLVEVVQSMADVPDLGVVLIGEGAYKARLIEKLTALYGAPEQIHEDGALNCGPFYLLPFQPYEDISHVFSLGDVGLVISKPGVGANSVPSKTWSIMSASRPVLANFDENELKDILQGTSVNLRQDGPCGLFTKAGDAAAFKTALMTLHNDRTLCRRYGLAGRQFILANLTKEVGTRKYVDVIKSVVKEK